MGAKLVEDQQPDTRTRARLELGGWPLVEVTQDNMFELKDMKAARLWMLPPAAMEVAIELLWEDKLAHPQWPHVLWYPIL